MTHVTRVSEFVVAVANDIKAVEDRVVTLESAGAGGVGSFTFASLPALTFTDYRLVFCPDHPLGAGLYRYNGMAWTGDLPLAQVLPNQTAAMSAIGVALTVSGATHPAIAATNRFTAARRYRLATTATTGALAYSRCNTTLVLPGSAGVGGYYFQATFSPDTLTAGVRGVCGLISTTANPTNIDWLTNTAAGKIALAYSDQTGNLRLIHNIAGTAPTVIDLGANFAMSASLFVRLELSSAPQANAPTKYRVTNLLTSAIVTGSITTNQPTSSTGLSPIQSVSNNTTAAACAISSTGWKLYAAS